MSDAEFVRSSLFRACMAMAGPSSIVRRSRMESLLAAQSGQNGSFFFTWGEPAMPRLFRMAFDAECLEVLRLVVRDNTITVMTVQQVFVSVGR